MEGGKKEERDTEERNHDSKTTTTVGFDFEKNRPNEREGAWSPFVLTCGLL